MAACFRIGRAGTTASAHCARSKPRAGQKITAINDAQAEAAEEFEDQKTDS
jgi:hypothetical protein